MRDPEYDRFGPWILEISDEDPPPPLFVPYLTRKERPLLSIKIPRKIERRVAKPGMNLYDYMVTLYEEDLVILQRVENDVQTWHFFYDDVQYIQQSESLLRGILRLAMTASTFDLPFNTVSSDIINRLVDLLRARSDQLPAPSGTAAEAAVDPGELSFYFNGLLEIERTQTPALQVLASQSDTGIGATETTVLRRLLFGIINKTLLESLHLSDGRELKIISRGRDFKYNWQVVHGKEVTYLPASHLSGVSWEPDAKNAGIVHLRLQTPAGTVSFALMRENESLDSYARFLTAVPEQSAFGLAAVAAAE